MNHIVYQSQYNDLYYGFYSVLYPPNPLLPTQLIGENGEVAAYPAVAAHSWHDGELPYELTAIAYLSGTVENSLIPYPYSIPWASKLRIRVTVYYSTGQTRTAWFTILQDGNPYPWAGVPAIIRGYRSDIHTYHFILTYVGYTPRGEWPELETDLNIGEVIVDVPQYPGQPSIDYTPINPVEIGGGPDMHNPSTAIQFSGTMDISDLCPDTTYLFTIYEDPGNLQYCVMRRNGWGTPWEFMGPVGISNPGWTNYNPHISAYGDRIFVTWTWRSGGGGPGEIVRRHKHWVWRDFLSTYWEPEVRQNPPQNAEPISYWDGHSSPYHSDYSQGSATSVVWVEQLANTDVYLRDVDPDDPTYNFFTEVDDDYQHLTYDDLYPHEISWVAEHENTIHTAYCVSWTRETRAAPPDLPYRIAWQGLVDDRPRNVLAFKGQDSISIIPPVPIYLQVLCGDAEKSYYCVKRDGYSQETNHKVDIGHNELIYYLPFIYSPFNYVIRAIASAPTPTIQTFSFNGNDISVSLTPAKPETLFFVLTPQQSRNGNIDLKITGTEGAYLENLRVYQVAPLNKPVEPSGIIVSDFTAGPTNLTVIPNPLKNSTTIQYSIPQDSKVELTIYDIAGKTVVRLVDGAVQSGNYSLTWNKAELPAGIYFIRLKTKIYTATEKLMILR